MSEPTDTDMRDKAAKRAEMSLQTFLTRLIWLCVLPLLLLTAWLAYDSVLDTQARRDVEAANLANNFALAMDQRLNARIGALRMLAASPLLDDAARHRDLYMFALGMRPNFGGHVILVDSEMHMLFNTRVPFGTPLPLLPRPKGHAAAPTALATGQPAVGDLVFGPVARVPLVAIAVPAQRRGKTVFLLLATFETQKFQERINQLALPAGWSLSLLDGTGAVIARRAPSGFNPAKDVDAAGRFIASSKLSPWTVVLEIPRDAYRAPLLAAAASMLPLVLGATLIAVLGGLLASRRLAGAVAALAENPTPGAPLPEIHEIATVRQLLDAAAKQQEAAKATLRESEARYRKLFEYAPDGIVIADDESRYLDANPSVCRMLGYAREELIGLHASNIIEATETTYVEPALEAINSGKNYQREWRFRRKDGSIFTAEVIATKMPDGKLLGVIRDITERKLAEEAISQLNAGLERRVAERTVELSAANRELDAFAYAVSHDLRAPLRAMSGFSQALLEDYGDQLQGEARVYLGQIDSASARMSELIDGLLALSRSTRGELRRDVVDISALSELLLAELARGEPERRVTVEIEPGLAARGDARMIEVVLRNLLGNAWKYSAHAAAASIRVYGEETDGARRFCVADNGAGFNMAHAGKLFQPFQRLHRQDEFPGIGIGLATVQRIVHRHGGTIAAWGEPGKGATFCFTLGDAAREAV
ncbi:MAG: PAS domain S-box protein [Gallionellaceae bacterium]|nr:PAS domain S-box protein [Gallionellaceae bacterium]